jgi:hypothetical protein
VATGATRYGAGDVLAVPALTKDGRQISVEFTIVLMRDANSEITGMAAILRNVTARFEETRRLKRQLAERARSGARPLSGHAMVRSELGDTGRLDAQHSQPAAVARRPGD